jgi:glycopeptide antibiotics resistance protein
MTVALWVLVCVYGITLACLALWPTPVDAPLSPVLTSITDAVPWLTYARMEFAANILLFVPFGFLFTLIMRRAHYVVLPAAIVVTVSVESWQSLVDERTSSILDIVANVTGACVGILLAALIRLARR